MLHTLYIEKTILTTTRNYYSHQVTLLYIVSCIQWTRHESYEYGGWVVIALQSHTLTVAGLRWKGDCIDKINFIYNYIPSSISKLGMQYNSRGAGVIAPAGGNICRLTLLLLATIYNYLYGMTIYDDACLHLIGWKLAKRIFLHILSLVFGDNMCCKPLHILSPATICAGRQYMP